MADVKASAVESPRDFGDGGPAVVKRWLTEIEIASKGDYKKWEERGRKIVKRYRDERPGGEQDSAVRLNILWSNVEVLRPSLYARTPKPQIDRRYRDSDPLGRAAGMILERAVAFSVDSYDFDQVMQAVVMDRLLPGRGTAWVRYIPTFGAQVTPRVPLVPASPTPAPGAPPPAMDAGAPPAPDPAGGAPLAMQPPAAPPGYLGPDGQPVEAGLVQMDGADAYMDGQPYAPVDYEEVRCEFVYWEDFLHGAGRVWAEVPWVARKTYQTREDLLKRFGEVGHKVKLDFKPEGVTNDMLSAGPEAFQKAVVWEIWEKATRKAIWIAPSYADAPLDERADPLKLKNFFPCPRPVYASQTTDTLVPVPDFAQYQDQADELDRLTTRIKLLTQALKVAGVYDASVKANLQKLVNESTENLMIPVEGWAAFAEKGGLQGVTSMMPIKEIADTLIRLYEARDKVKSDLYEVSGISDIIRGQGDASETATAQRIKGQFATLRLGDSQRDVARFARDLIALKAEIIAEHFSPQTLMIMTGYSTAEGADPALFEKAVALLRNDALRSFRIDIETDSTIALDDDAEKQARGEFITAISSVLQQGVVAVQQVPELLGVVKESLLFLTRGFRVGRGMENALEESMAAVQKRLANPPPPPPDPQMEKVKGELALKDKDIESRHALGTAKLQSDHTLKTGDQQIRAAEVQGNQALAAQKQEQDMQVKGVELGLQADQIQAGIASEAAAAAAGGAQ